MTVTIDLKTGPTRITLPAAEANYRLVARFPGETLKISPLPRGFRLKFESDGTISVKMRWWLRLVEALRKVQI